jgi:hypothetical protein
MAAHIDVPMDVDVEFKPFDPFKLDELLLLQLDDDMLNELNIKRKIKLCLDSCKNIKSDNTALIYTIIKGNEKLRKMLKRIYKFVDKITKLQKDTDFIDKLPSKVGKELLPDVFYNKQINDEIKRDNVGALQIFEQHKGDFNQSKTYFYKTTTKDVIINKILEGDNNILNIFFNDDTLFNKWEYKVNQLIQIQPKDYNYMTIIDLYKYCIDVFFDMTIMTEISRLEIPVVPDIVVSDIDTCTELKDISGGVLSDEDKNLIDIYKENDHTYSDISGLNILMTQIDEKIKKFIGYKINTLEKYDIYIKSYVAKIFKDCKFYKLIYFDFDNEDLIFYKTTIDKEIENFRNIEGKKTYNFNIICYGKSLYYLLKYIYFIVVDRKLKNNRFNFILYCDDNSFNIYKDNLESLKKENLTSLIDFANMLTEYKTFSQMLNRLYDKEKIKNCYFELGKLKELGVNIYFMVSNNYLMRGIGCKRAIMNCTNFYISMKTNHKEKYLSMHLDDNITAIVDRFKCTEAATSRNKHCIIPKCISATSECEGVYCQCKCDNLLDSDDTEKQVFNPFTLKHIKLKDFCTNHLKDACTGVFSKDPKEGGGGGKIVRQAPKSIPNTSEQHGKRISTDKERQADARAASAAARRAAEPKRDVGEQDKKDAEKKNCLSNPEFGCEVISITKLYKLFILNYVDNKYNIIGVKRDHNNVKNNEATIHDSQSIYKLSLHKSYNLYKDGFQYNPFFTRFAEDTLFNFVNGNTTGLTNVFYLRFAHQPVCSQKTYENHEDYFKSFILNTYSEIKLKDSVPIFSMYLHYLHTLKIIFNPTLVIDKMKPTIILNYKTKKTEIKPFGESKYNYFTYVLYKLLLADNQILKECNDITEILRICNYEIQHMDTYYKDLDSTRHNVLFKKFKDKLKDIKSKVEKYKKTYGKVVEHGKVVEYGKVVEHDKLIQYYKECPTGKEVVSMEE